MQIWSTPAEGGFLYSDNLSRELRTALQPMTRFRQFCDAREALGLGRGDTFNWNVFSDVADAGGTLNELDPMPETGFTITQNSLQVEEYGNSVPYTGLLDNLSEQPIKEIIHKVLKDDARRTLDTAAHAQFDATLLNVVGTDATTVTLTENGTPSGAPTVEFNNTHAKLIADLLAERNIPTFDGTNYMSIARPSTLRTFKNNLELIHQYTSEGWNVIMNGEKGRYEGIRYCEQTNIPKESWAFSDPIFFFGADTVTEAVTVPEEIRAKIPSDYGRSRGIAWYSILGYGLNHTVASESRIIKWASTES